MTNTQQTEIQNEVKEKLKNSFELFSFWDIIDCCELTDEQKNWAKVYLTYEVRLCIPEEIEANQDELNAEINEMDISNSDGITFRQYYNDFHELQGKDAI